MFYGNFGVMVRALTYVMILGKEGLRRTSQVAVLNARYLEHELSRNYDMAIDQPCMHEFVMTLKRQHHDLGVSAMDIAKGMIDRGIHPPTMYFPLIVEEALMVEPTETEPKAVLDEAVRVLSELLDLAASDPQALQACPTTTPVGRIDEVQAARHPILRWQRETNSKMLYFAEGQTFDPYFNLAMESGCAIISTAGEFSICGKTSIPLSLAKTRIR